MSGASDPLPVSHIQSSLARLADFLEDYLPLANAHNTDFITHDHWHRLLPPHLAGELLQLDDASLAGLPMGEIMQAEPGISGDPIHLGISAENTATPASYKPIHYDVSDSGKDPLGRPGWDKSRTPTWRHHDLASFVQATQTFTLEGLGVLQPLEEVLMSWHQQQGQKAVFVDSHMSAKKSHEVEVMAEICDTLAQKQGVNKVVDIGSGRGYLSCHLSQMYGFHVLGIDSSTGNTHSAQKRSTKLKKHWKGLARNAARDKMLEQNASSSPVVLDPHSPSLASPGSNVTVHEDKSGKHLHFHANDMNTSPPVKVDGPQDYLQQTDSASATTSGIYVPVTFYVQPDLDLSELLKINLHTCDNIPGCCKSERDSSEGNILCCDKSNIGGNCVIQSPGDSSGCVSGTSSVSANLVSPTTACNNSNESECVSDLFLLTGLHTCGGLAVTMIQLYLSNPQAVALASVGCCYNFIEEEFLANPYNNQPVEDTADISFPISSVLRERKFRLGRNARLVGCQAVNRIKDQAKVFSLDLTVEDVERYSQEYAGCARRMQAFFQLKNCLALCIEAVILLDRLLYLREQQLETESHLVRLFDPVTSPRCFAILSIKPQETQPQETPTCHS